jgi:hypothetical protein
MVGDDRYLTQLIDFEILKKNPSLLTGEYAEIFYRLADKLRDYGTRHAGSNDCGGEMSPRPKSRTVSYLSDYRKTRPPQRFIPSGSANRL